MASFTVRLEDASLEAFDKQAESEGMGRETLVRHLMLNYVSRASDSAFAPKSRPCVIGLSLPPVSEEITKALELLHTLFSYVDGQPKSGEFEVICAGPKSGLTYDEAFIICQKRYFEVGWIYADAMN
jgi:hypothetical protein